MATDITGPDRDHADPALAHHLESLTDCEPDRDLWPGISRRLTPLSAKMSPRHRWPIALAAGLALVAGASFAMTRLLDRGPGDADVSAATVLGTPAAGLGHSNPNTLIMEAAIEELESAADTALPRLDPPTRAALSVSLEALNGAIADAARQAQVAPEDRRAEQYLAATLDRKREVLRSIVMAAARQTAS
ncbi:MAG: hypothetical protein U0974_16045 [Gemmatimonadales bacterium]|nr:hypothetical protein [Gemmatimonadales bacterium]MDZ4391236.1 hypothetical protein [Gemmatimonadales bacterium]